MTTSATILEAKYQEIVARLEKGEYIDPSEYNSLPRHLASAIRHGLEEMAARRENGLIKQRQAAMKGKGGAAEGRGSWNAAGVVEHLNTTDPAASVVRLCRARASESE